MTNSVIDRAFAGASETAVAPLVRVLHELARFHDEEASLNRREADVTGDDRYGEDADRQADFSDYLHGLAIDLAGWCSTPKAAIA